jgi:signal transduction histidine kinase
MKLSNLQRLRLVKVIYWLFLAYMVAAFVWWYISLENQNRLIAETQLNQMQSSDVAYVEKVKAVQSYELRKQKQFLGEGVTFLFLFVLGAAFVYRSLMKQIRFSNQQQNFMMAVTHELKTPIAVTQLNIETLLKRTLPEATQMKLLQKALLESKRLDGLVNNILITSQLEQGEMTRHLQSFDFSISITDWIDAFKERYPTRIVNETIAPNILIMGEPLLLELLFNNLLENANKYTSNDLPIDVILSSEGGKVTLKVLDQGSGIPVAEKSKIFEKFYRIGNEETRKSKGTGLGLYLCRKIAEFHKAGLYYQPNTPQGSQFIFTI